ncbi:MAG: MIP/aquaporin family protein [Bacteroidota bacterium]
MFMNPYLGELIGTFILMFLGNSINANTLLKETFGNNSGWVITTIGWGLAVFTAVFIAGSSSGAHINPAVTVGLAIAGRFSWSMVPGYIGMQMLGAFLGAWGAYLQYRPHFTVTKDPEAKLGLFSTRPAIKSTFDNFVSEALGTFVLVFAIFFLVEGDGLGSLSALPVGLLVVVIGMALGGSTGYAINPARDLGPRIFHALAPISGKRDSNWGYSWIPVVGPMVGGALAAGLYLAIKI